jgi:hypothetical protein
VVICCLLVAGLQIGQFWLSAAQQPTAPVSILGNTEVSGEVADVPRSRR